MIHVIKAKSRRPFCQMLNYIQTISIVAAVLSKFNVTLIKQTNSAENPAPDVLISL